MADDKTLERIAKLLRLAAPSSGTSEHERASAALEAARLIEQHNLVVQDAPPPRKERRKRRDEPRREEPRNSGWSGSFYEPPRQQQQRPQGDWTISVASADAMCADNECAEMIHRGERVWRRMNGFTVEYIHFQGPCGW